MNIDQLRGLLDEQQISAVEMVEVNLVDDTPQPALHLAIYSEDFPVNVLVLADNAGELGFARACPHAVPRDSTNPCQQCVMEDVRVGDWVELVEFGLPYLHGRVDQILPRQDGSVTFEVTHYSPDHGQGYDFWPATSVRPMWPPTQS